MNKPGRVTVMLPAELAAGIDQYDASRTRFVAVAVRHELDRRRRESFLRSIGAPHREANDQIDDSLVDWVDGLPDDADLVDLTAGTAVRWIEGQGWTAESG